MVESSLNVLRTIISYKFSTKRLLRSFSTGIWMWSFQIKFHKITSFRMINKITVNRKTIVWRISYISWLQRTSTADTFLVNFWDLDKFFWMMVFKYFSPRKTIFKVDINSPMLPQLISIWCLSFNIWTCFYLLYVLEQSEVVAWKSYLKMVFLKSPQNSQENIFARDSFAIKLLAGGLQLH